MPKLQLVLLSTEDGAQSVVHPIKSYKVPKFKTRRDFERFVKDTKLDVKEALAAKAYDDSLPSPGIESGCW